MPNLPSDFASDLVAAADPAVEGAAAIVGSTDVADFETEGRAECWADAVILTEAADKADTEAAVAGVVISEAATEATADLGSEAIKASAAAGMCSGLSEVSVKTHSGVQANSPSIAAKTVGFAAASANACTIGSCIEPSRGCWAMGC